MLLPLPEFWLEDDTYWVVEVLELGGWGTGNC